MKTIRNILLLVLLVTATGVVQADPDAPKEIPREIIVRVVSMQPIDSVLQQSGITAQVIDSLTGEDVFLLQLPPQAPVETILQALENNPSVEFAHRNYEVLLPVVNQVSISFPDENRPPLLSGTSPEPYFGQPAVYGHGIDSAGLLTEGSGEIVAVIDNGIATTHPLFTDRLLPGYDFHDNDADPAEDSGAVYGHGTFVAGLIALTAPAADIMPIRAFDGDGVGDMFAVANAVNFAIDNGATVINMSFNAYIDVDVLRTAVSSARSSGIVMVASAGNDTTSVESFPAAYPDVIAVSSIDTLEAAADFTNFGGYVDLCAPGVNLYSALAGEYEWGTWSGSSFSAALVTGSVALVGSFVDTSIAAMGEHLRMSARRDLESGAVVPPHPWYGWGAVDAWHAVFSLDRGDVDLSGMVDPVDISIVTDYLFTSVDHPHIDRADTNCDVVTDGIDLATMIGYLFQGESIIPCYLPAP